jgi:hypothetical protein
MPALPLYAPIESRDGSLTKGAFTKNAFVEKVGDAINSFRRPGLASFSTLGTSLAGQGITNYFTPEGNEYLFAGFGGSLYNSGARSLDTDFVDTTGELACSGSNPATIHGLSLVSFGGLIWAIG